MSHIRRVGNGRRCPRGNMVGTPGLRRGLPALRLSPSPGSPLKRRSTLSHEGRGVGTRCVATAPPLPLGRGRPQSVRALRAGEGAFLVSALRRRSPSPFPPCDLRESFAHAGSRRKALSPMGRGGASCGPKSLPSLSPRPAPPIHCTHLVLLKGRCREALRMAGRGAVSLRAADAQRRSGRRRAPPGSTKRPCQELADDRRVYPKRRRSRSLDSARARRD
jgi:hypothetical protein